MKPHPLDAVWNNLAGGLGQPELAGIVKRVHTMEGRQPRAGARRKVAAPRQDPADDFVGALGHGLALLECWQESDVWLSNSDLASRSGLTRPTVSRLASVLVDLGYLARENQRGRLRLTTATLDLGFGSPFAAEPAASVHPELARLARELDVYASLGIHREENVQVLDNVASPLHPHAVHWDVGALLPVGRTASGGAAFSALPEAGARPLVERLRSQYGAEWDSVQRQLDRKKQECSSKGYCTSIAGISRDVAAVALPIVPAGSDDIFVLGCAMPATDYHRERVERELVPQMMQVARGVAAALAR